jgi:hypothetical protein
LGRFARWWGGVPDSRKKVRKILLFLKKKKQKDFYQFRRGNLATLSLRTQRGRIGFAAFFQKSSPALVVPGLGKKTGQFGAESQRAATRL